MKKYTIILGILFCQSINAQNFSEASNIPFEGVLGSSSVFFDSNNDNYQDVILTGFDSTSVRISKLYKNDGLGSFSEMQNTPFNGLAGAVGISDVNNDSNLDILFIGRNSINDVIAELYLNDGEGNFSLVNGTPFENVTGSSVVFSDINNDSYQDVFITGEKENGSQIANLYINDGMGNFSLVNGTPFQGVVAGSVAIDDVNGDSFKDIFITGVTSWPDRISKLYLNDGVGNFSEVNNSPFESVAYNSVAFIDVNNDSFPEILITGRIVSNDPVTRLYLNDGMGNYNEDSNVPFENVDFSSIAYADVNLDQSIDIFISGKDSSNNKISKLYLNTGDGGYYEYTNNSFVGVYRASVSISDTNGDLFPEILITGENNSGNPISKLYINNGFETNINEYLIFSNSTYEVYPNPNNGNEINLKCNSQLSKSIEISIFNSSGILIHAQTNHVNIGMNEFNINTNSLDKGIYIIRIKEEKQFSSLKMIIK